MDPVRSILNPGAALAAVVVVGALLALVLLDRGGAPMPAPPVVGRLGPPLRLHPPVPRPNAGLAQYGPERHGRHHRVLPEDLSH